MHAQLLIGEREVEGPGAFAVTNKYSGAPIGTCALAGPAELEAALAAAQGAAPALAAAPAWRRSAALAATSRALTARREELARTIAQEAGKALKFARAEVDRAVQVFALAAEEAGRIHGETVPLDASPSGAGYFGFWQRRPRGVLVAITPFNFPLNLVAHKLAPALAAGNPVVLKPAERTPLTAWLLAGIVRQALAGQDLPLGALGLVQGPGAELGPPLVEDPRVAMVSFTGSRAVGQSILARAGLKRVTLELGNTTPVIVAPDADLDLAAERCALGAYYNSGQVCISVQRVYADPAVAAPLRERFVAATERMVVGDPLAEETDVGPMIALSEAERAERWVQEAVRGGAQLLCGGRREGPVHWPTLLGDPPADARVMVDEVFAPVASLIGDQDFERALRRANEGPYGLQVAVFSRDLERVLHAIEALDFGGVIVNDTPAFRADAMPYGGNRQSGLGREGVRFAIEEMTNVQMVVIRRTS